MKDKNGFAVWPTLSDPTGSLEPRAEISDITKPTTTDYGTGDIGALADKIQGENK
jgi:hypothetical protein